ncbi:hypothetical protein Tsubulata_041422 [Turnera subulata]|uniref:Uncharacterized protein n=1 Tax=Turnera subulata TaxID=218843 RepID=A0A9Q0JJE4_9ROSI|nr:hypothetical protein Tsubulata_041422 [Turnera subulata]
MDDLPLEKIAISGPTLASMMQRLSSSRGDVDGLLFGHVTRITPSTLSDDTSPSFDGPSDSSHLVATVTSFLCPSSSPLSFYDSLGRLNAPSLSRLLPSPSSSAIAADGGSHFLGWLSFRRRSQTRPSMREYSVSHSLSRSSHLSFPVANSETAPVTLTPCIFLLFATPVHDQAIHTHDYRAYQFRLSTTSFEPKPIDIVNIGPAFRGHYESFSPNSAFPMLNCEMRGSSSPMVEEDRSAEEQKQLDLCAEGFDVGDLKRLMGVEATGYTRGLEDLYEKMLVKIDGLARQVESSNAQVIEQEKRIKDLRYKAAARSGAE